LFRLFILKYFLWHDFVTSTAGILLGFLAAFVASRVTRKKIALMSENGPAEQPHSWFEQPSDQQCEASRRTKS
jgi:hypothetical protein